MVYGCRWVRVCLSVVLWPKRMNFPASGGFLIYLTFDLLTQHSTFKHWKFIRSSASHAASVAAHFHHKILGTVTKRFNCPFGCAENNISRPGERHEQKKKSFNWIGKCLYWRAQTDIWTHSVTQRDRYIVFKLWVLAVLLMCKYIWLLWVYDLFRCDGI